MSAVFDAICSRRRSPSARASRSRSWTTSSSRSRRSPRRSSTHWPRSRRGSRPRPPERGGRAGGVTPRPVRGLRAPRCRPAPHPGRRPRARPDADAHLLAALRAGDEAAFAALVTRYHASLKRVARAYVSTDAVAEEVVQDTWLAVIAGIDRFEQRATLKTWVFHILANKAKTRGMRERRIVPFASLGSRDDDGPAVSPDHFQREGDAWPGHWATPPRPWEDPERRLESLEARERLREAIAALPDVQQAVLTLRDVEGLDAAEVCALLELTRRQPARHPAPRPGAGPGGPRALLRGAGVSFDEIVCREFAELATDYLDGALPDATLELVEEHLAMCDWCRDYLGQIEATSAAVAHAPAGRAGPRDAAGARRGLPRPSEGGPRRDRLQVPRRGRARAVQPLPVAAPAPRRARRVGRRRGRRDGLPRRRARAAAPATCRGGCRTSCGRPSSAAP